MQTKQNVENVVAKLRFGLASLFPQDNIEAILFGSYARGDADPPRSKTAIKETKQSINN